MTTANSTHDHFRISPELVKHDVEPYRFAGVPDEHGVLPQVTESSAHGTGVEAARTGYDLTAVVEVGLRRYPGTVHEVATLIAASCLGWFTQYNAMQGGAIE
jgi:hypothetical protein